jgi:hypothetical protein
VIDSLKRVSFLQNASKEEQIDSSTIHRTFESPPVLRKRKGEERTPPLSQTEKCKQSVTLATPLQIKNMKAYHAEQKGLLKCSTEGFEHNGGGKSATNGNNSNSLFFGGGESHVLCEARMGAVEDVECFKDSVVNTLPNGGSQSNPTILNPKLCEIRHD